MLQVRHRVRRWTLVPLVVTVTLAGATQAAAATPADAAHEAAAGAAIPADWVSHTDDTGTISIATPPTWNQTDTTSRTTPDGQTRPTLQVSPDLPTFLQSFDSNGVQVTAIARSDDHLAVLDDFHAGSCGSDASQVEPYATIDAAGVIIRRDCGQGVTYTELVVNTVTAPNHTVVVHIGLNTQSDPAWRDLLLTAWTFNPAGTAPSPATTVPAAPTVPAPPAPTSAPAATPTDALTFFTHLYGGDPAQLDVAQAMTAPGSPADAYVTFQRIQMLSLIDLGITPAVGEVTVTADGFQVCDGATTCLAISGIEFVDGLISHFSFDGLRIDERLAKPVAPMQFGDVTVELLTAYYSVAAGTMRAVLEVTATGSEQFDFTTASFAATDGTVFSPNPNSSLAYSTTTISGPTPISLDFDGAHPAGELRFSFTTAAGETVPVAVPFETFVPATTPATTVPAPSAPATTTPGPTDAFDALAFVTYLYSADPAEVELARAMTTPGSPAEAYAISNLQVLVGLAEIGGDPLITTVSETPEGITNCAAPTNCLLLNDFEVVDGKVAHFLMDGNRIDERLVKPGEAMQFGAVTVELLTAYYSPTWDSLLVYLHVTANGDEQFDFTAARFVAPDGTEFAPHEDGSNSYETVTITGTQLVDLDFDGAPTAGELHFSYTTAAGEIVPVVVPFVPFVPLTPTDPATTTAAPTSAPTTAPTTTDAETFFAHLVSRDPARLETARTMTAPDSPAAAYVTLQMMQLDVIIDRGLHTEPMVVTPTDDGFEACSRLAGCDRYTGIEMIDGLISHFEVMGNPLHELVARPGPPVHVGDVTVELSGALDSVAAQTLRVVIEVTATGSEHFDFTAASFVTTDGTAFEPDPRTSLTLDVTSIDDPTAISLDFDGAHPPGELHFSYTTAAGETVPVVIPFERFETPTA